MEFRTLGRTGWRVSAISVGTEYLLGVPQEQATRVIHEALDRGVNYFDVFWAQPEFRDAMGAAFRGRRHEAMLAGHLAPPSTPWTGAARATRKGAALHRGFLRRYHTDYIDAAPAQHRPKEDYDR